MESIGNIYDVFSRNWRNAGIERSVAKKMVLSPNEAVPNPTLTVSPASSRAMIPKRRPFSEAVGPRARGFVIRNRFKTEGIETLARIVLSTIVAATTPGIAPVVLARLMAMGAAMQRVIRGRAIIIGVSKSRDMRAASRRTTVQRPKVIGMSTGMSFRNAMAASAAGNAFDTMAAFKRAERKSPAPHL